MHTHTHVVICVQRRQVSVYDRGASFVQDKPHPYAIPKHQERLMRLLLAVVVVLYQQQNPVTTSCGGVSLASRTRLTRAILAIAD